MFLHVPVIFDYILAVVSIVFALRARARQQHGLLWAASRSSRWPRRC